MIEFRICGTACISTGNAFISPFPNAAMMSPADVSIIGIPVAIASIIACIINGNCSIKTGNAATSPCAMPFNSSKPACNNIGACAIRVCTM